MIAYGALFKSASIESFMTSRLWSCETLAKGVTMVAQTEQKQEATLDEKIQVICLCKWTDEVLPFNS